MGDGTGVPGELTLGNTVPMKTLRVKWKDEEVRGKGRPSRSPATGDLPGAQWRRDLRSRERR